MLRLSMWVQLSCLLLGLMVVPATYASGSCDPDHGDCVKVGELNFSIALGYGLRSNPVIDSDDIPIYILPSLSYYGERFFINNRLIGYSLFENDTHLFNVVGTMSFDQVYFDRWNVGNFVLESDHHALVGGSESPILDDDSLGSIANNEFVGPIEGDPRESESGPREDATAVSLDPSALSDRNTAVYAGFEYAYFLDRWAFNIQGLQDVIGAHDGKELRIAVTWPYSGPAFSLDLSAGFVWQSEKVVNHYYGISEEDAPDPHFIYEADAEIVTVLRADWKKPINDHWHLQISIHHRMFGSEITDSPLVEENASTTVFMGGVYHF